MSERPSIHLHAPEAGWSITSRFPEAQVLNLIDLIDARLEEAFNCLDNL